MQTNCILSECVFIKILFSSLNTMLIVDKYCSDVCCDEFPVPQIDRKSKQVKEQWHGQFYLQSVWGKLAVLNIENIRICGWITKLEARKCCSSWNEQCPMSLKERWFVVEVESSSSPSKFFAFVESKTTTTSSKRCIKIWVSKQVSKSLELQQ